MQPTDVILILKAISTLLDLLDNLPTDEPLSKEQVELRNEVRRKLMDKLFPN